MFEAIVDIVSRSGYLGIFLLMLVENLFPPIPSELIMPLAGFAAARGDFNIILVVAAGTAGSVVGALPWYYLGVLFGRERLQRIADKYGRWLTLSSDDIDVASRWFERHGRNAIFFGRLVPAIRTLISVPAGMVRMPMLVFLGYSTAGSLIWTGLLAAAGFALQAKYVVVAQYLDPVSKAIVALIIVGYIYRLVRHAPRKPH